MKEEEQLEETERKRERGGGGERTGGRELCSVNGYAPKQPTITAYVDVPSSFLLMPLW